MVLGVVGVSFREAALEAREAVIRLFKEFETNPLVAQRFLGENGSFVLLLTCHRAEMYFFSPIGHKIVPEITALISEVSGVTPYCYQGFVCFRHLFTVTSGMDSLIFGETEIQGQVKRAYMTAKAERELPFALHFLFQKALKEGKGFRSQLVISHPKDIMESVIEEIITECGKSREDTFLFIGYSVINRKIARGLKARGYPNLTFCSRKKRSVAYNMISRNELSFEDPYDVIFFGFAESIGDFPNLSLESLASIRNRLIFDLNVPRTLALCHTPTDAIYLDMDFISECVQQKLQKYLPSTNKDTPFLALVARKQWEAYEKKHSYIASEQIRVFSSKSLIL
ncbi:glutamyl-tRNA reductase [Chlamydia gallinacea]|uniref:glutamyl-tRNA reductase n=1 Tax=Chlamydia gallinacea TaxID=1457153 RepID=UPI00255C8AE5|nr:glutamyl-tRNA reductase [Chlamydia gallinacea]